MLFISTLYSLALVRLVEDYDAEIRRVLTRRLGCVEAAADIAQETYRRLTNDDLLRQAENPRALMYRIAMNLATDYERRAATRSRFLLPGSDTADWPCPVSDPEGISIARERLEQLHRAIEQLPPRCRQVFVMRKFEDLSQAEIADRLGLTRNSVEKHLRNALEKLRASLGD